MKVYTVDSVIGYVISDTTPSLQPPVPSSFPGLLTFTHGLGGKSALGSRLPPVLNTFDYLDK